MEMGTIGRAHEVRLEVAVVVSDPDQPAGNELCLGNQVAHVTAHLVSRKQGDDRADPDRKADPQGPSSAECWK